MCYIRITAGKAIYNEKVDIYSLGIIFFEMCHPPLTTGMERIKVLSSIRLPEIVLPHSESLTGKEVFAIFSSRFVVKMLKFKRKTTGSVNQMAFKS